MKTPSLLAFAAILCLALSSCVPTSESPLSSADTAKADPKLIGDWLDKNDQETYHITAKDGAWMHVDVLKAGAKTDSYDFYLTQIGKNSFANVVLTNTDKQPFKTKGYTFIRYSISDKGTLKMWSMNSEATLAAVKAHKLQATVTEDKNPDISLKDNSADLTKFLETVDLDKLFTNQATLTKVASK